jgi:hypothetical protein
VRSKDIPQGLALKNEEPEEISEGGNAWKDRSTDWEFDLAYSPLEILETGKEKWGRWARWSAIAKWIFSHSRDITHL